MTDIIKSLKLIRITKYFCPPRNDRVVTKLFHKIFIHGRTLRKDARLSVR